MFQLRIAKPHKQPHRLLWRPRAGAATDCVRGDGLVCRGGVGDEDSTAHFLQDDERVSTQHRAGERLGAGHGEQTHTSVAASRPSKQKKPRHRRRRDTENTTSLYVIKTLELTIQYFLKRREQDQRRSLIRRRILLACETRAIVSVICTLFKITYLGKWNERGERPVLWPLASFPDRHTYSALSAAKKRDYFIVN